VLAFPLVRVVEVRVAGVRLFQSRRVGGAVLALASMWVAVGPAVAAPRASAMKAITPAACKGLRAIDSGSSAGAMAAYNACIDAKRTAVIAALAEATAQQGKDGGGYRVMRTLAFSPPVAAMPAECRGRRALDSSATSAEIAQFNACAAARSAQKASTQARASGFDYSVDVPPVEAQSVEAQSVETKSVETGDTKAGSKTDRAPEAKQEATSEVPEAKSSVAPHDDDPRPRVLGMAVPAVAARRSDQ
jgi:hypothetical protein